VTIRPHVEERCRVCFRPTEEKVHNILVISGRSYSQHSRVDHTYLHHLTQHDYQQ
jgi:hypothetical protein